MPWASRSPISRRWEFVRYIGEFNASHQGCASNLCADVRLPPDKLRRTFAEIAPDFPVIGIYDFD